MKRYRLATMLACVVVLVAALPASAQNEPEKFGWGFPNFTTPRFSWDVYRWSYFGIPADSGTGTCVSDPFACLFYEAIFKEKLPDPGGTGNGAGNCFGLSILSLMMQKYGGYQGFCIPLISHGRDTVMGGSPVNSRLTRAINIMHGHQLSLACVESYIEQAMSGHSQNSSYGVTLAQQALAKDGPFLVCITNGWNPMDGGHTIIGYKVTGSAGNYKIWVVDPNRIWADTSAAHRGWYTSNSNFIQCNTPNWSFDMAGSGAWPSGAGHLVILPISIAGPTGRNPASLGLGVPQLLTKIFIWGRDNGRGMKILQMTESGRRLFLPGERGRIDWDTTGIRNTIPWLVTGTAATTSPTYEGYYHVGALTSTAIEFESGERGASLVAGESRGYVRIDCHEADVRATVHASGLAGGSPNIAIGSASKPITVDIEVMTAPEPGRTHRFYTLRNVVIPANVEEGVHLSVDPVRGVAVQGVSSAPALFTYRQTSEVAKKNIETTPIAIRPNEGMRVDVATMRAEPGITGK
jgi:hypothetical protein